LKIEGIIWLDDIIEKIILKHSVSQIEVKEIFNDKPSFHYVEKGYRSEENVYSVMGQTNGGRYLIIFFIFKINKYALILSARKMSNSERKLYEKK
jgi:hypothetical protein